MGVPPRRGMNYHHASELGAADAMLTHSLSATIDRRHASSIGDKLKQVACKNSAELGKTVDLCTTVLIRSIYSSSTADGHKLPPDVVLKRETTPKNEN